MSYKKLTQHGIAYVEILIAVVVISVIGFVGYKILSQSKAATPLSWAPPSGYANYPVFNVPVTTSNNTNLDGNGGDMYIKLPSQATGPITIKNCRNAVVIGGQINIPANTGSASPDVRGIYVNNCSGTVHIEGVYIDGGPSSAEGDGIAINSPNAIVQVENVRINKLNGGYDTAKHNHSDIIQPWGGVKELRVDFLTGSSNYQGFQINDDMGHIGKVTIKNTNIGDSGVAPPDGKGGYYLWLKCGTGTQYSFSNFYLNPRSGRSLDSSVWKGGCSASTANNVMTFSGDASGTVKGGSPSADFVPAGTAGLGYKSTGYAVDSSTTTTPTPTTPTPPPTTPTTPSTPTPTTPTTKEVISSSFDGTSTSWQAVLSTWALSGGRYGNTAVKSDLTTNSNVATNPIVVSGDFTLNTTGKVVGTSGPWDDLSVLFGYQDTNNYYYVSFNESNDGGTSGIFKVQNGTKTQLKDITTAIKSDTDYKVTVVRSGDTIKASLNGTEVANATDSTYKSGKVGFGSMNNTVSFDSIVVTQP
ncbi:MAG: hypothetical protein U0491_03540 [Candidatus Saccharimonadales bacterium]